jgi:exosortase/archaeosortase family protein
MAKKENVWILDIVVRYAIAALSFLIVPVFYIVFKSLTIGLTWWIMSIFYSVQIFGNSLFFPGFNASVEIITACIAGSAYFLLFLLNLLTRDIKILKRIYLLLFSFVCLFLVNVVRLIIVIPMFLNNSALFDITHKVFWFALSVIFVALIWILSAKVFRISKIPVYSDVAFVLSKIKKKS